MTLHTFSTLRTLCRRTMTRSERNSCACRTPATQTRHHPRASSGDMASGAALRICCCSPCRVLYFWTFYLLFLAPVYKTRRQRICGLCQPSPGCGRRRAGAIRLPRPRAPLRRDQATNSSARTLPRVQLSLMAERCGYAGRRHGRPSFRPSCRLQAPTSLSTACVTPHRGCRRELSPLLRIPIAAVALRWRYITRGFA